MNLHRTTALTVVAMALLSALFTCCASGPGTAYTTGIKAATPSPGRFIVRGHEVIDTSSDKVLFFKGMGYSPFMPGESPLRGDHPANDGRYEEHLSLMQDMGVNYLHVFPMHMPPKFFEALDRTDMLYGQDIFVWAYEEDFLNEAFLAKTIEDIKAAIDHTYAVGRPERLVLFSIGDELQPDSVVRTDARHPQVRSFTGKHISVANRTPTEIALARLIDAAMDYELTRYGQRHLYCHTSWTHIGPLSNRPDLEVPMESAINPDLGDLVCLNVYTYARGVTTSPPGSVTGSTYQGYVEELTTQTQKPVFITQVGLSTSPYEPKPWVPGFGGHRVEDVPRAFADVWRDVRTAQGREKICGLSFFELHDEWWKSGEDAVDATRHNEEDPEEWFGIFSIGPDRRLVPKGGIAETVGRLYRGP